jgi:hypothetical protein
MADAPTSYLVLWPERRISWFGKLGEIGRPLTMMYGSPHGSAPSLKRYGIGPGDRIFIVSLKKGAVSVLARATVGTMITTDEYFRDHLRLSKEELALHLWTLSEKLEAERRDLGHRLPFGCVDEVALFAECTPLTLGTEVPPKVLAAIRFQPKTGAERALPLVDGKLKNVTPIQGHFFRLSPASARALDRLVAR